MKTVVVIPAFNEAKRIGAVLDEVLQLGFDVIVVDDGSGDGTHAVAQTKPGVQAVRHRINLGKGAALKTGCDFAVRRGADCIVVMDSDGQHRPDEVPALAAPVQQGTADIVFGVRKLSEQTPMPFVARLGNRFLSTMTHMLFGLHVTDTQSGFRAFSRDAYAKIRWTSTNYEVETEMVVLAGKARLRSVEVPIATIYHDRYKGTTVFDGIKIFSSMVMWRMK